MLADHIKARMFELEETRTWERNPQLLRRHDRLEPGGAGAVHVCAGHRTRAPGALEAAAGAAAHPGRARQHQGSARHLRQGRHRDLARRAEVHRARPAARVPRRRRPAPARRSRRRVRPKRRTAIGGYIEYLETELAPKARASFRLGREKFEQKLRLEEGIALPRRSAAGDRDARAERRRRKRSGPLAGKLNGGDPAGGVGEDEGGASGAGRARRTRRASSSTSSQTFLERQKLITLPPSEPVVVAPTPDFYRWSFASMWTPGPFESKPTRAYYYLTDVDPSWPPERQDEHLRDFNFPTLWSISIHEVYPGHFLHYQHLRQVESKVAQVDLVRAGVVRRRLGALLRADDDRGRLRPAGSEHQARTARRSAHPPRRASSSCIRLHAEDMSVEQGVRFFRDEAFLEEASARREAERGTFDPTYLVYTVGKLMLLKLRQDYKAAAGRSVLAAHVPRHAAGAGHRAVLAPSSADARRRRRRPCWTEDHDAALRIRVRRRAVTASR